MTLRWFDGTEHSIAVLIADNSEKGIKILAPAPYKVKQKMEKRVEQGKPILDKDGKPLTEEKTVQIPTHYREAFRQDFLHSALQSHRRFSQC